ncbi:MAG: alpha/beta hydrolase [Candidatus Riflebacteria bacterium]|nr:alpha/beta hydrolase [Candidatus Riflebacteria bacterium]
MRLITAALFSALLLTICARANATGELKYGPVQPAVGPGGALYQHESLTTWERGLNHERYQVFEPAEPALAKAGLVILLHDWLTEDPEHYMGLIRHLCRCGMVVVFPRFQGTSALEEDYHPNIVRSIKDFLLQAFARKQIQIDLNHVAIIGHGAGGVLAANLAASTDYFGLPKPGVVMIITPQQRSLKLLDLTGISRQARMAVISGDQVDPTNDQTAREIFYAADRIKSDNKVFITVLSDFYGQPPLIADELAPLSPERPIYERLLIKRRHEFVRMFREQQVASSLRTQAIDAFDWFAIFRVFDALQQIAFVKQAGLNLFKNTPELRFMGYWSDGRKLKGLLVTNRP